MKKKEKKYLPIYIDVEDFSALVIGGGKVALRKIKTLLDFDATVTVLSPKFCAEIIKLIRENKITQIKKNYQTGDIAGYRIVFCTTNNSEVSYQVKQDCYSQGVLLNVADVPELCNFIMPAIIKRGDFIIALSSQGKAPFFVKSQRDTLEKTLSSKLEDITELAGEFRSLVLKDKGTNSTKNQKMLFKKFLAVDWEKLINDEGKPAAIKKMKELLNRI